MSLVPGLLLSLHEQPSPTVLQALRILVCFALLAVIYNGISTKLIHNHSKLTNAQSTMTLADENMDAMNGTGRRGASSPATSSALFAFERARCTPSLFSDDLCEFNVLAKEISPSSSPFDAYKTL